MKNGNQAILQIQQPLCIGVRILLLQSFLYLYFNHAGGKYSFYIVFMSTFLYTLEELKGCPEPKQSQLFDYLGQIDYTLVQIDDTVAEIAQQIIEMGILTKKSYDDCQHIAAAIISECDCIISWNFKHIVNIKTIRGIRAITNLKGHKPIEILNPSVLLESEE